MPLLGKFRTPPVGGIVRIENVQLMVQETPAGLVNGLNAVFTHVNPPITPIMTFVYLNGLRQVVGTDFSVVGNTITFVLAPLLASLIRVDYWFAPSV